MQRLGRTMITVSAGALGVLIVGIGAAEVAMRYIRRKVDALEPTDHIGYVNGYHADDLLTTHRRPV